MIDMRFENIPIRFENKTFDNFYGNEKKSVIAYCKNMDCHQNIIFCGSVGTGKTHLAISSMREMMDKKVHLDDVKNTSRKTSGIFLSVYDFLLTCNQKTIINMKGEYLKQLTRIPREQISGERIVGVIGYDCVVIDDFGSEKQTEATDQNLFYLIDQRYLKNLSMIITTNLSFKEFYKNHQRIASRICENGKVFEFQEKDYRVIK